MSKRQNHWTSPQVLTACHISLIQRPNFVHLSSLVLVCHHPSGIHYDVNVKIYNLESQQMWSCKRNNCKSSRSCLVAQIRSGTASGKEILSMGNCDTSGYLRVHLSVWEQMLSPCARLPQVLHSFFLVLIILARSGSCWTGIYRHADRGLIFQRICFF